jgi:hypothetical protein
LVHEVAYRGKDGRQKTGEMALLSLEHLWIMMMMKICSKNRVVGATFK